MAYSPTGLGGPPGLSMSSTQRAAGSPSSIGADVRFLGRAGNVRDDGFRPSVHGVVCVKAGCHGWKCRPAPCSRWKSGALKWMRAEADPSMLRGPVHMKYACERACLQVVSNRFTPRVVMIAMKEEARTLRGYGLPASSNWSLTRRSSRCCWPRSPATTCPSGSSRRSIAPVPPPARPARQALARPLAAR